MYCFNIALMIPSFPPSGTDPEDVIKNAFGCFDEENLGVVSEDRLRELLTTIGDR